MVTKKDLQSIAKNFGLRGWSGMNKMNWLFLLIIICFHHQSSPLIGCEKKIFKG